MTKKSTHDADFVPLLNKFRAAKTIVGMSLDGCLPDVDESFIVSPGLATEIQKLCDRADFKFALSDLRLPYNRIFVEAPMTPEMTALRPVLGEVPIVRLGAFIATQDELYRFWPVWEFNTGELGFGMVQLIVSADPMPPTSWPYEISPASPHVHFLPLPATPFLMTAMKAGQSPEHFGDRFNGMVKTNPEAITESLSEVSFLLAAWSVLMNTKSGVSRTLVHRTPPSGAGKRTKALRTSKYTLLSLSAAESVTPQGQTMQRHDATAHYVRGHFKQRASGVYWWQPHVRGRGPIAQREAYLVRQ